ncbi:LacI family transcriptional regulator, partial [Cutibacterium acnes]
MTHKPTIKDVARLAGVSLGTASRVLNGSSATSEASRSAVHNAAHELGYLSNAHARSLRSSHSGVIGLVVPDIRNPYFAELASVVENACLAYGWATLLCNADESPDQFNRYVNTLRRQRVDGAIVTPTGSGGQAVKDLVDDGVQVVCVDREITGSPLPAVTSDPWNGMRQAVHHLVDHGHRRIGFITGPQQTSTGLERYQAYRQLLAEHGLEVDEDLVVEGDFQEESGRMGARRLLDGGATAIFASDSL